MAIPTQTQTVHHVGNVVEDIHASIDAEDFPFLAEMLNGLYSDPITAIVREMSTNALDSHIDAGNTAPIQITLPTEDRLEFIVQDFGLGLNVDDLRTVYSKYGRSTKRGSNDVAGQLGMGCKSPLSYTDAFTISAVKGGVKTIAMSTKDEGGVSVIKVLDTCATDEPNGVRITIPVGRWDVSDFTDAADHLFQFWAPGTVLVNGEPPAVPDWRATALALDDWGHTYLIRSDAGLYSSYVVMGNVAYPVKDAEIGRGVSHRFVCLLNMGDVDFVPSREAVKHTPHTDATLGELTEYIRDSYKRALNKALATVSSRWEEAMLKTLWMDRGLRIESDSAHPIWNYTPRGYGHRKARAQFSFYLRNLAMPNQTVITGFNAKNLSTVARARLLEFVPDQKRQNFIVIPANVSVANLDGRPNTYTWNEVIGATAEPVKAARAKQKKYETRYNVYGQAGGLTGAELAELDGPILYLEPNSYMGHGTLGATIVTLRSSNQLPRVRRFVPHIEPYHNEVQRQRKAAEDAVTAQDRLIVGARSLPDYFAHLDPDAVADDELATAIRLRKTPDTATIIEANRFGVDIKAKGVGERFNKRYPLIAAVGYYSHRITSLPDDVLLYVNAKWAADTAAIQGAAAS